jgi:hypothetical protein
MSVGAAVVVAGAVVVTAPPSVVVPAVVTVGLSSLHAVITMAKARRRATSRVVKIVFFILFVLSVYLWHYAFLTVF